mgnify:CR=1 FL=1
MEKIVECVPNISEGRNAEVISACVNEVRAVGGVTVLDVSSDADHNRTVITFVGEPDCAAEAAVRCAEEKNSRWARMRMVSRQTAIGSHSATNQATVATEK